MSSPLAGQAARNAIAMGLGLAILGAAGFGFLSIVGNTVSDADKVALTNLYMIINIIGPGLFVSLEQETNRVASSGLAAGIDARPGIRRTAMLGGALVGITVVVLTSAASLLVNRNLGGHTSLLVWLAVGVATSATVFWVRGILGSGQEYFGYSVTLAGEGLARLVPCVIIALLVTDNVDLYAIAYVLASAVAVFITWPWLRQVFRRLTALPTESAAPAAAAAQVQTGHTTARIARGLVLLGVATLLAQVVANLAPLIVSGRMVDTPAVAAAFGFAFVLTRIPLLLFGPVQAMLLPALTAAVVREDYVEVRQRIRTVLIAVAAVGFPGALFSALVGPWLVVTFFGATVSPSATVMGLLGLSTVLLMIAQIVQPALVALGKHHMVSAAWVVGTIVLVGLMILPGNPIDRAVLAQLIGPLLVVLLTVGGLWLSLRARAIVSVGT